MGGPRGAVLWKCGCKRGCTCINLRVQRAEVVASVQQLLALPCKRSLHGITYRCASSSSTAARASCPLTSTPPHLRQQQQQGPPRAPLPLRTQGWLSHTAPPAPCHAGQRTRPRQGAQSRACSSRSSSNSSSDWQQQQGAQGGLRASPSHTAIPGQINQVAFAALVHSPPPPLPTHPTPPYNLLPRHSLALLQPAHVLGRPLRVRRPLHACRHRARGRGGRQLRLWAGRHAGAQAGLLQHGPRLRVWTKGEGPCGSHSSPSLGPLTRPSPAPHVRTGGRGRGIVGQPTR